MNVVYGSSPTALSPTDSLSLLLREREWGIRIMAAEVNLAERYPSLSPSLSPPRPKPQPERVSGNVKELGKGRNRLLRGLQSEVVSPFFYYPSSNPAPTLQA